LTYNWDPTADITVRNNVFEDAYVAYSYHLTDPVGLITQDNMILLKADTKMQFQRTEKIEQAAAWQAETGQETGSTMTVLE
jgi:hypothetical protein